MDILWKEQGSKGFDIYFLAPRGAKGGKTFSAWLTRGGDEGRKDIILNFWY